MLLTLQVLARSCLALQIFNFPSDLRETAKQSLQLPKPTRNSFKIANKLMIVASGEINLQSKHDLICHEAKVKAATSAHSMADVIPF